MLSIQKTMNIASTNWFDHNVTEYTQRVAEVKSELGLKESGNQKYGEILYRGECSLKTATEAWDKSPAHAKIMNDREYKNMVCVMVPSKDNTCIITCEYAKDIR